MKPEDVKRIEDAASQYAIKNYKGRGIESLLKYSDRFQAGATYEHNYLTTQIVEAERKGWNEAIDEALTLCARINRNTSVSEIYDEIQKLKK